ncbi:MCE family protein [Mycolicibacterium sp. XJ1819]
MTRRNLMIVVAVTLTLVLVGGIVAVTRTTSRINLVAYFDRATGLYEGDQVVLLGVPVGRIDKIEPQPNRVKISFWYDSDHQVPADANAVILSPSLVTVRQLELTPAYTGGPVMADGAVIPQERTAVPLEYDDLREQLQRLTETLQPTEPGGVSTLGAFVNTAADNLRGQGPDMRKMVISLSEALAALDDHSDDLFGTFENVATLVKALRDSSGPLAQLNRDLAAVTQPLVNQPNELEYALTNLNDVVGDVSSFVAENRDAIGTTSDRLVSVSDSVVESIDDVKQLLHVLPSTLANFQNFYQPAQATFTGVLTAQNFANPLQFICSAVEAAARLGAAESAKRCIQYMAPIFKNRQYNFPPLGINPVVGPMARPNEVTYSEDWLRPDYIPPAGPAPTEPFRAVPPPPEGPLPPANELFNYFGWGRDLAVSPPLPTDPETGLRGMMLPATSDEGEG